LALLAYAARPNAKPLTPELAAQVASFAVVELNTTSPFVPAALASHGSVLGPQPDATFFPANLLMCAAVSCTSCTSFDLSTLPADECFGTAVTTLSVAIVQPSNIGLQTSVVVGTPGCIQFLQVTTVNTCFNL
ncbi:hypothetical protein BD413DRAFT_437381, partial [Trametes elegans]